MILMISDQPVRGPLRRLAELFGLTPAEERLLAQLTAGDTLTSAAQNLGVSVHTARCQLKAIQGKTAWRTQSELIRRMQQACVLSAPTH